MTVPEYARVSGVRVQVLSRRRFAPTCRNCGDKSLSDGGRCPACQGTGRERPVVWATVGFLEGDNRGHQAEVRDAALRPVDAEVTQATENGG